MSDLISRQDAIDICNSAIDLWDGLLGCGALVAVKDRISELPSAEPERKTGEWTIEDVHSATYKYCCSECKAHHRARYDFCPTCGARMEGEER